MPTNLSLLPKRSNCIQEIFLHVFQLLPRGRPERRYRRTSLAGSPCDASHPVVSSTSAGAIPHRSEADREDCTGGDRDAVGVVVHPVYHCYLFRIGREEEFIIDRFVHHRFKKFLSLPLVVRKQV